MNYMQLVNDKYLIIISYWDCVEGGLCVEVGEGQGEGSLLGVVDGPAAGKVVDVVVHTKPGWRNYRVPLLYRHRAA